MLPCSCPAASTVTCLANETAVALAVRARSASPTAADEAAEAEVLATSVMA